MSRFPSFLAALAVVCSAIPAQAMNNAPPIKVERDGRYLYYRVTLGQLGEEDQREVIDGSVELLRNEVQSRLANVPKIKTLSNFVFPPKVMDQIAAMAQQTVLIADAHSFRGWIPSALMIYGGIDSGLGFLGKVGLSGDLGLVIRAEKVIRVDTWNWSRSAYTKFDYSWVIVPHGNIGTGVGAGASKTVGVAAIWGNMTSARDFSGAVAGVGADAKFLAGVDGHFAVVDNPFTHHGFLMGRLELDVGPEANADLDAEGGLIIPLDDALRLLAVKIDTNGILNHSSNTTEIGKYDWGKAPDDQSKP